MLLCAEDLPASICAFTSREQDGCYTALYEMVRSLTLFGAHAAGEQAIETMCQAFRELDGLDSYARRAARDGFTGMMAIHPRQVAIINAALSPDDRAIAHAHKIIAAFEAALEAGDLQIDGRMIDVPHIKQACKTLEHARETAAIVGAAG